MTTRTVLAIAALALLTACADRPPVATSAPVTGMG